MSDRFKQKRRHTKEVMLLSLTDHRYEKLKVLVETAHGLECEENEEGTLYRFIKHGPGFTMDTTTMWFAVMGTPFTSHITDEDEAEPVLLDDYMELAWGEKIWGQVTDEQRGMLLKNVGCTVNILPLDLPEDSELNEIQVYHAIREYLQNVFKDFATSEPEPDKIKEYITYGVIFLLGAFVSFWITTSGIWQG